MMEMLRQVPCFIDTEPPSTKMSDFFSLTKWISVNLGGEPPVFISAWLLFGTPESAVSVVIGVRNIVRQRALLFERLEVVEAMWTFISHRMSSGEKLHAILE
ncbi:hypothetical protein CK203_040544 [Vitis vinifera]|uniref:Uncharacterized protein n=1 Tax=Vitis vinifera TaxID=29760 RepID=A0A438HI80_VITVI|nr:hypothetical protein CK203_040544 [Vitis vinifera]